MTFNRFEELVKTKYPEASVCAHGKFGGTEKNGKVEINFKPNSKCYCYYGSYQVILAKIGIKTVYNCEIQHVKAQLLKYKAEHGKKSRFFDFIIDNSNEIDRLEKWLDEIANGEYVFID